MKSEKLVNLALISAVVAVSGVSTARAEPIALGETVPEVESVDQNGKAVSLRKSLSDGLALVYFYPKADTPGCTKQACSLRDSFESLTDKGLRVIGVSMDSVEDQKAFAKKYELPFTLLADSEGKVVKAFGVPELRPGFASRQAFLFKDGKLVWRDLEASTDQQAADVLAILNKSEKSTQSEKSTD